MLFCSLLRLEYIFKNPPNTEIYLQRVSLVKISKNVFCFKAVRFLVPTI